MCDGAGVEVGRVGCRVPDPCEVTGRYLTVSDLCTTDQRTTENRRNGRREGKEGFRWGEVSVSSGGGPTPLPSGHRLILHRGPQSPDFLQLTPSCLRPHTLMVWTLMVPTVPP